MDNFSFIWKVFKRLIFLIVFSLNVTLTASIWMEANDPGEMASQQNCPMVRQPKPRRMCSVKGESNSLTQESYLQHSSCLLNKRAHPVWSSIKRGRANTDLEKQCITSYNRRSVPSITHVLQVTLQVKELKDPEAVISSDSSLIFKERVLRLMLSGWTGPWAFEQAMFK